MHVLHFIKSAKLYGIIMFLKIQNYFNVLLRFTT
jgi:hypothetical protein